MTVRPFIYTALGALLLGVGLSLLIWDESDSSRRVSWPAVAHHRAPSGAVVVPPLVASTDRDVLRRPREGVPCVDSESVKPVLHDGPLEIHGQVTTPEGQPLQGVLVRPFGGAGPETRTGEDGSYTLSLLLGNGRTHLMFSLKGYHETHRTIHPDDVSAAARWPLNVELHSVDLTAPVIGVLRTVERLPVAGQSVHLHSASLRVNLVSVSDPDGRFEFPEVPSGKDYRLWLRPEGNFEDFAMSSMEVPADGVELEIVLTPLATARIGGHMVDVDGNPVGRLTLWLTGARALGNPIQITGDDAGYFEADTVPTGQLMFQTRTYPRFTVRQIEFPPDGETDVRLVIDQGLHEVTGIAIDALGAPVSTARVELFWYHFESGVRSSSHRKTTTDEAGRFAFTRVGRGLHKLMVSAPGYDSFQLEHDVGGGESLPPVRLATRVSTEE